MGQSGGRFPDCVRGPPEPDSGPSPSPASLTVPDSGLGATPDPCPDLPLWDMLPATLPGRVHSLDSQMAGGRGFGFLTPQWACGGTAWGAGAGLGDTGLDDTCCLRSRPAGPVQTFPNPVDTGLALPRVPGLTDHGGWDSGGLAWMGRAEGFLEEVLHVTLVCRVGGEVILVGVWEGPEFPPFTEVWGHCSCCPPCQPACLLALCEPWRGPGPVPACP